jgi:hypothetical protein
MAADKLTISAISEGVRGYALDPNNAEALDIAAFYPSAQITPIARTVPPDNVRPKPKLSWAEAAFDGAANL